VNAAAQAGAIAALEDRPNVEDRVAETVAERDRMADALSAMGVEIIPGHANFILASPPVGTPEMANAWGDHLFNEAGIIVNHTRETGLERFIRFSMSLPEHNRLFVDTTEKFLSSR
jgi:histidinol-phosphate aminotransferase